MPAIILLAMTGALALLCFVKAGSVMFLGAPRTKPAMHAHECGPLMRGSMLVLAVACVGIGLAPVFVWPAVARAAQVWHPTWGLATVPESLQSLGLFHVLLVSAAMVAVLRLWGRSIRNGLTRSLTWDCGYAEPKARMQYTGGSFSQIAAPWFAFILQPVLKLKRPRGYQPTQAYFKERVPETVLENVIAPFASAIMRVSTAVRRLQHGRLQSYILYLLAGLFALGLLIFMEALR